MHSMPPSISGCSVQTILVLKLLSGGQSSTFLQEIFGYADILFAVVIQMII